MQRAREEDLNHDIQYGAHMDIRLFRQLAHRIVPEFCDHPQIMLLNGSR